MGKSQKKKSSRRHNPMRVPDSHLPKGLASASSSSSKTEAILPIIQKMSSTEAGERKWACVAVSNLIYNDPSTRRLLQGKNIVGELITRLSDSEDEVVVEAAGALRNLCIDGGYDICAEMYNKNILAPLQTFIPKISTTLSQFLESSKNAPENAQAIVYDFADNVVTILWCLSETSNKALNAVNQLALVPFLMSFLAARQKIPLPTVVSAAQCLYVLTDDNRPVIEDVRSNSSYLSCLHEVAKAHGISQDPKGKTPAAEERTMTLSLLACGILRNVSPIPPPSTISLVDLDKEVVLPTLLPVISSTSLHETSDAVQRLAQKQQPSTADKPSIKGNPGSDHKTPETIELERIEARLRAVQLALEILTGVCATLPDPDLSADEEATEEDDEAEDDDEGGMDDADDSMAVEDPAPVPNGTTDADKPAPSILPSILVPLLALIQPTPLSFPPLGAPSPHAPTTSALSAIHVAAFECLNNAFLALAARPSDVVAKDVDAGKKVWDEVWRALSAAGTQGGPGQDRRMQVWDVAVGVLWAAGIIWPGKLTLDEEHVKVLMQLCDSRADDTVRVKCIGTLESLARAPDAIDANRIISNYLLSLLPASSQPSPIGTEPMLQACSSLIDIYSDEECPYDVNFRSGNYVQRLTEAVEGVRRAVRGIDRKKEGGRELRRRGEEVRDNLVAFIKYRRGLKF
ncbi:ARM repeat-containing protein [Vararia minispora EC-137]|uniref:ARM repeat-containing protein n=1 Tax=Vararia minispora EC-137 TaxID=1314806 RepID=A0ACB8QLB5_9AGAM|nr:ARM repeat-containing protein [Vararia minispora EC-137]